MDNKGGIHGTDELRTVGASIMPSIISGHLNAHTIIVAKKLADTILGGKLLAPIEADVWSNPE